MFLITSQFYFSRASRAGSCGKAIGLGHPPPQTLKKHKHAEKNDRRGLRDRSDKDGLSVFTYFWFHTEDSGGGGKPQGLPILGSSCFKATAFGGGRSGGGRWVWTSGAERPLIKRLLLKSHIFTSLRWHSKHLAAA